MSYYIKHPTYGIYVGHVKVPRFRRKRGLEEILTFDTQADALAFLKDRRANPGMEDCTVEEEE